MCAFTQGNVSAAGTNGTVIKEKLAVLKNHGCTLCGSVPLANDGNNPHEAGILTVNYVKKQDGCAGVCPPVNRMVELLDATSIDGANVTDTGNDTATS